MRGSAVVAAAVLVAPGVAGAGCPPLPSIVNRDYAIDLYSGVPLGSGTLVSMGGAGAAYAIGSSGTLINPSAPAVRPTTDLDWWSLDVHFDVLTSAKSTDNWNDGCLAAANGAGTNLGTFGIAGRLMDWAAAATFTIQSAAFENSAFAANAAYWKLALARWIPQIDTAIGVAANVVSFSVVDQMGANIFDITGVGFEAGAQWIPRRQDVRAGLTVTSPLVGGSVSSINCDPATCMIPIDHFPDAVYFPWRVTVGAAYRFGPTRWNQLLLGTFRDERALTLVADVVATGYAPNAYGIEAFTHDQLERSGRTLSWSVRAGAELELLPGRLRVRAGSYYEPARFDAPGVTGRVHGTFGVDLRLFEVYVLGYRRGRVGFNGDLADNYDNFSFSIGFWH